MNTEIDAFNQNQPTAEERQICERLFSILSKLLPDAENRIWHRHPVWFIEQNPIVGYSRLKAGIRLMFWSGASFDEPQLKPGTGKFKDASMLYSDIKQVQPNEIKRWVEKAQIIQWDYKNIYKRKGRLVRLK